MLELTVNGERQSAPDGVTVYTLLEHIGRDPEITGVAVAVADRVVRRSEWATTAIEDGSRVEIITASQGG
ncbi:MAG: sulfur carrier protein ThiS [Bacteroidota bacterium]